MELKPAIQEIRRGCELMAMLQSHIHGGSVSQGLAETGTLCEGVLQSCDAALCKLKQLSSSPSSSGSHGSPLPSPRAEVTTRDRGRKRGRDSEEILTETPFNDGRQWRKYGEKNISGSIFPRCYYRCSYKEDQGCQAKIRVQQHNTADPPLYVVTYDKEHACTQIPYASTSCQLKKDLILLSTEPFSFRYDSESFNTTKQEEKSFSNLNSSVAQACARVTITQEEPYLLSNPPSTCDTKQDEPSWPNINAMPVGNDIDGKNYNLEQVDVFPTPSQVGSPDLMPLLTSMEVIDTTLAAPGYGFGDVELFNCYLMLLSCRD